MSKRMTMDVKVNIRTGKTYMLFESCICAMEGQGLIKRNKYWMWKTYGYGSHGEMRQNTYMWGKSHSNSLLYRVGRWLAEILFGSFSKGLAMMYPGPFHWSWLRYMICLWIGLGQDGLQHDISRAQVQLGYMICPLNWAGLRWLRTWYI